MQKSTYRKKPSRKGNALGRKIFIRESPKKQNVHRQEQMKLFEQ